jgi:tRNA-dihydrouridine synthase
VSRRFSVAPMMDWTDRHCRFFLRLLSKNALLYTEMVTTGALINGDADRFYVMTTLSTRWPCNWAGVFRLTWPFAHAWLSKQVMTK